MKKTFGLIVMVSLLVMSACSQAQSDEQGAASTIDQVLDKGKLVVGTAPGYYPFEMKDMNGEFVGYDIDVAKAIAEALDVEVEFQQFGFDGLIPALQTGEIDMILAGMTIRGDRALSVSFSDPYHTTGQVVMLPKDDTDTKSWEDLDQPNKKIAVSLGTTGALLAKQIFQDAEIL
ncbi:MAG: transporter substrate-binding domain-containing protein, partial [Novibacillus thermophilus]